jgi:hypothetical protein
VGSLKYLRKRIDHPEVAISASHMT